MRVFINEINTNIQNTFFINKMYMYCLWFQSIDLNEKNIKYIFYLPLILYNGSVNNEYTN